MAGWGQGTSAILQTRVISSTCHLSAATPLRSEAVAQSKDPTPNKLRHLRRRPIAEFSDWVGVLRLRRNFTSLTSCCAQDDILEVNARQRRASAKLSPVVRLLQGGYVKPVHLKHCLHDPFCFVGVFVSQQFAQNRGNDLPP